MKLIHRTRKWLLPGLLLFFILLLWGCQTGPVPLDSGFDEPADPDTIDTAVWQTVPAGLQGSFGTTNIRFARNKPPDIGITHDLELSAWKGETVSAQLLLWSSENIEKVRPSVKGFADKQAQQIRAGSIQIRPVRYVLTDEFSSGCGYRSADTISSHLAADILDTLSVFNIPAHSTRPLWITLSIPKETNPGNYSGSIEIESASDSTMRFTLSVLVHNWTLPEPSDWSFHLDLWQNPFAVARYHDAELWSQEHLELLRPLLTLLAGAGQKCITTSIVDKPWGGQTHDPFESMITWIRNSDGRWEFDYHLFDLYVSLAMDCGIAHQINCYSMVPWGNQFKYLDEDSSKFITIEAQPGTAHYEELWRPFLYDFRAHLMEMGWLDKITIALDERNLEEMKNMFDFLHRTVPEFKIAMAGHYFEEVNSDIYDFSYNWGHVQASSKEIAKVRRERKQITTYYVACGIPCPNNFTFSPPAESTFEGWFAAAMGFDGFLRWAYNSWVEDPLKDSRFRTWPAGDTYFVYPGPRSSIRFEKLKEGIQDYEKISILQETFEHSANDEIAGKLQELNSFLEKIRSSHDLSKNAASAITEGKKLITEIIGI